MFPYFLVAAGVGLLSAESQAIQRVFQRRQALLARLRPVERAPKVRAGGTSWTYFDVLACTVLIGFAALRYEVGTDYQLYTVLYGVLDAHAAWWPQMFGHQSTQEFGYTFLALLFRGHTDSPRALFLVMSIITVLPVYATIKKRSNDPTMSLLLYVTLGFFVAPFNIIRQGAAVSLNFWANTFLDSNRKAFVAINAVAASLHSTVIIAAVIQWALTRVRRPRRLIFWALAAGLAGAVLFARLVASFGFLTALNPRYQDYLTLQAAGIGTYLIIASRAAILGWSLAQPVEARDERFQLYAAIGLAFLLVGTKSLVLSRMELYFGLPLILLVPNQLAGRRGLWIKVAFLAAGGIYLAEYLTHYAGLLPYQTFVS